MIWNKMINPKSGEEVWFASYPGIRIKLKLDPILKDVTKPWLLEMHSQHFHMPFAVKVGGSTEQEAVKNAASLVLGIAQDLRVMLHISAKEQDNIEKQQTEGVSDEAAEGPEPGEQAAGNNGSILPFPQAEPPCPA